MYTAENKKPTDDINVDIHFRIVCKTKKGAFVRVFKENKLYIWEDFYKMFVIKDNIYAYFNEETAKKIKENSANIMDFTNTVNLVHSIQVLGGRVPLVTTMLLGTLTDSVTSIFPIFDMNDILAFAIMYTTMYRKLKNDKFIQEQTEHIVTIDVPKYAKTKSGRQVERDIVKGSTTSMADVKGADKLRNLFKEQ